MPHIGPMEAFIVFMIVLVLFGGGRVAKLGSEMGEAIANFRKNSKDPDESQAAKN